MINLTQDNFYKLKQNKKDVYDYLARLLYLDSMVDLTSSKYIVNRQFGKCQFESKGPLNNNLPNIHFDKDLIVKTNKKDLRSLKQLDNYPILDKDYIRNEFDYRYKTDYNEEDLCNTSNTLIIDKLMLMSYFQEFELPAIGNNINFKFFNPNLAYLTNKPVLDFKTDDTLFELFKIDKTELFVKLDTLSNSGIVLNIIGLGGTMSNLLYWLVNLCEALGVYHLFKRINIYDNDDIELSNLPRIPLNWTSPSCLNYITFTTKKALLANQVKRLVYHHYDIGIYTEKFYSSYINNNQVYIGSPDLITRNHLSNNIKDFDLSKFILSLHLNDNISIFCNPGINDKDIAMSIESYGSIDIGYFYLNMIWMTLKFIDILLDEKKEESYTFNSKTDLDLNIGII